MRSLVLFAAMVSSAPLWGAPIVSASDKPSLQAALLALTTERFQPMNLHVAGERAWLGLSGPLPEADAFEVEAPWLASSGVPALPLVFQLRPLGGREQQPVQATLAVPLQRQALVATRRLRKGSLVRCADFRMELRDLRDVSALALPVPCQIAAASVALRDMATRDVVRSADVGVAPDVVAGAPVRVSVINNGIEVTTSAIALNDANAGDRLDVRLRHAARTLTTRATGPGTARLVDELP
jgi:flagella basal body P-ring formation protein FlgA